MRVVEPDPRGPFPDGVHTLSSLGDVTLIDGKRMIFGPFALRRALEEKLRAAASLWRWRPARAVAVRSSRRRRALRRWARGSCPETTADTPAPAARGRVRLFIRSIARKPFEGKRLPSNVTFFPS